MKEDVNQSVIKDLRKIANFYEENPDRWFDGDFVEEINGVENPRCCVLGAAGFITQEDYKYYDWEIEDDDVTDPLFCTLTEYLKSLVSSGRYDMSKLNDDPGDSIDIDIILWNDYFVEDVDEVINVLRDCANNLERKEKVNA